MLEAATCIADSGDAGERFVHREAAQDVVRAGSLIVVDEAHAAGKRKVGAPGRRRTGGARRRHHVKDAAVAAGAALAVIERVWPGAEIGGSRPHRERPWWDRNST